MRNMELPEKSKMAALGSQKGFNPRLLGTPNTFRKIGFLIRALPLSEKVATEKKKKKKKTGAELCQAQAQLSSSIRLL